MRVVLADLPFSSLNRPNLALETLGAGLRSDGFECDVIYSKLAFAKIIGAQRYRVIAESVPSHLLLGDFLFSRPLENSDDNEINEARYIHEVLRPNLQRRHTWLVSALPELRLEAEAFLEGLVIDLSSQNTGLFGLSLTFQLVPQLALAYLIKQRTTDIPVIVGGSYCQGDMGVELHRAFPFIDYLATGEAEKLVVQLAQALSLIASTGDLGHIDGLLWRRNGESISSCAPPDVLENLDELPFPDYGQWQEQIADGPLKNARTETAVTFETSRGCWFGEKSHCTFCGLNGESLRFRSKSPKRAIDEINDLLASGFQNLEATDLILDQVYIEKVVPALAAVESSSIFYEVKSNLTRHQVRTLALAGVNRIQPGIESLSTRLLSDMRKGVAAYQNIRLLKWCLEHGVIVEWSILYGFPNENPLEYRSMAKLFPHVEHLQPPRSPGNRVQLNRFSPLLEQAVKDHPERVFPAHAYTHVFGKFDVDASEVAYYFSDSAVDDKEPDSDTIGCLQQLSAWISAYEEAVFLFVDLGERLTFCDTRSIALHEEFVLTGDDRRIFLACDAGISYQRLRRAMDLSDEDLLQRLMQLVEQKVILDVDSRFLATAVDATGWVSEIEEDALKLPFAVLEARRRARRCARDEQI